MSGRYHLRTKSTFPRIVYPKQLGIILRFSGILLRIGGTRSLEYSLLFKECFFQSFVFIIRTHLPARRFKGFCHCKALSYIVAGILCALAASLYPTVFTAFYHSISAPVFRLTAITGYFFVCHNMIPISDSHP